MTARPNPVDLVSAGPRLHPEDVEAIAASVAALLLRQAPPVAARLVDAATLATILDVERDWVYAHAQELHAVRLGGKRGRLRFDLATVLRSLNGESPIAAAAAAHTWVARTVELGGELLPIDP